MNRQTQVELLEKWYKEELEISGSKGHDYAGEDVLQNFRRMKAACTLYDINPAKRSEDVFLYYIFIKIDRLINLLHSNKSPQNESIEDTIVDLNMYLKLFRCFLVEARTESREMESK